LLFKLNIMKKLILFIALFGIILNSTAQDKKISELNLASTPVGDSALYIAVQSATTKKQYFIDLQKSMWYGGAATATGIGTSSLNSNTGAYNTAMGYQSLYTNSSATSSTAFGYKSLYTNNGTCNSAFGYGALEDNTSGTYQTAFGVNALANSTIGDYNTAVGASALVNVTLGSMNTAVGYRAGYSNSVTGCVYLGFEAGYNNTKGSVLFIDNSNDATPLIWGDFTADSVIINGDLRATGYAGGATAWTNESDSTQKKNIVTIDNALIKVSRLRGVEFEWKDGREPGQRIGFLAQEVKEVMPEVVSGEEGSMSIQYAPVVALLTQAIQEQQKHIQWLYVFCGALSLFSIILLVLFVIGKNE
jgi:hypothetical protein